MGTLTCIVCSTVWEANQRPRCPKCMAEQWQQLSTLVTPKHDPASLAVPLSTFRSVVPAGFGLSAGSYLSHIANSGSAYYSVYHHEYFDFALVPPGMASGSAVPRGSVIPTTALNGFLIARAYQPDAHIYPEDLTRIEQRVTEGKYQPLQTCIVRNCSNLRVPPSDTCAQHSSPPLARVEPNRGD
jgi:hypothetical protein